MLVTKVMKRSGMYTVKILSLLVFFRISNLSLLNTQFTVVGQSDLSSVLCLMWSLSIYR